MILTNNSKKLAVIAYSKYTAQTYKEQLREIFHNLIEIETYSVDEIAIKEIESDLILASTHSLYEIIKKYIKNNNEILVADITLKKESHEKLKNIPSNTNAILVNTTVEMAVETIGLIYNSGINHIDLIPYYPGMKEIPNCNIAITPGEIKLVPQEINNIVNLGNRVLSMRTIINIAIKLNLSQIMYSDSFDNNFEDLIKCDTGLEELWDEIGYLKNKLDLIELEQNKFRNKKVLNGHAAKYTFDDIAGQSNLINNLKETAKKIALSNSSVLIYGESGTGKELLAQSIHNESNRKSESFIAINCASIPENLLESELFGYDEGAFTGAKKGGKIGYFEQANKGTLFLDEINEIDIRLQSRLLRVLQEREVIRIGGNRVIKIDVRIIAASNKNLRTLVYQGKFRKDLYYRLNVLYMNIPNLNERKEDIPLIIEKLKKRINANFKITDEAMNMIKRCNWEGNIRELGNYIERLNCIGIKNIDLSTAKQFIDEDIEPNETNRINIYNDNNIISKLKNEKYININQCYYVLNLLYNNRNTGEKLGRRSISNILSKNNIIISEQEIRTITNKLKEMNIVNVSLGRGGTTITTYGEIIYKQIEEEFKEYID